MPVWHYPLQLHLAMWGILLPSEVFFSIKDNMACYLLISDQILSLDSSYLVWCSLRYGVMQHVSLTSPLSLPFLSNHGHLVYQAPGHVVHSVEVIYHIFILWSFNHIFCHWQMFLRINTYFHLYHGVYTLTCSNDSCWLHDCFSIEFHLTMMLLQDRVVIGVTHWVTNGITLPMYCLSCINLSPLGRGFLHSNIGPPMGELPLVLLQNQEMSLHSLSHPCMHHFVAYLLHLSLPSYSP